MVDESRIRRAAAGGGVLLLHVFILLGLLAAFRQHLFEQAAPRIREVFVTLPAAQEVIHREKQRLPEIPPPTFLRPELPPRAITVPQFGIPPANQPARPQGDMNALGWYLYNCTGANYEKLSAKEKAHCLINKWKGVEAPRLTLGPVKPSPFAAALAKRNAPAVPVERPCPMDSPQSNLGLPCFDFGTDPNPLNKYTH